MVKKVLICPLDWGLGHATRCVPIVWELQKRGVEILIASSGNALHFLRQEFPTLSFFELPGYNPEYPTQTSMSFKMMAQLPKFIGVVNKEHEQTKKIVQDRNIDIVIADNRYGCWSSQARSIFIAHQVDLLMPSGFGWVAPIINSIGHRYIRNFHEVWIPDQPGSGLTTPFVTSKTQNQKYIGWLSRFQKRGAVAFKYEIIALVSGPEPQRTVFENLLTRELKASGLNSLLVAGKPNEPFHKQEGCVEVVNHLATRDLEDAILSARMVISRSGYSTVMDLIALNKKAVFVPTPGQTEQEYLAKELKKNKVAYAVSQNEFKLFEALNESTNYTGFSNWERTPDLLTAAVENSLSPTPKT